MEATTAAFIKKHKEKEKLLPRSSIKKEDIEILCKEWGIETPLSLTSKLEIEHYLENGVQSESSSTTTRDTQKNSGVDEETETMELDSNKDEMEDKNDNKKSKSKDKKDKTRDTQKNSGVDEETETMELDSNKDEMEDKNDENPKSKDKKDKTRDTQKNSEVTKTDDKTTETENHRTTQNLRNITHRNDVELDGELLNSKPQNNSRDNKEPAVSLKFQNWSTQQTGSMDDFESITGGSKTKKRKIESDKEGDTHYMDNTGMDLTKLIKSTSGLIISKIDPDNLTSDICKAAVELNGLALQYVPKVMITQQLCDVAVNQNYLAFIFVPEGYKTLQLCRLLVANDRLCEAVRFLPSHYFMMSKTDSSSPENIGEFGDDQAISKNNNKTSTSNSPGLTNKTQPRTKSGSLKDSNNHGKQETKTNNTCSTKDKKEDKREDKREDKKEVKKEDELEDRTEEEITPEKALEIVQRVEKLNEDSTKTLSDKIRLVRDSQEFDDLDLFGVCVGLWLTRKCGGKKGSETTCWLTRIKSFLEQTYYSKGDSIIEANMRLKVTKSVVLFAGTTDEMRSQISQLKELMDGEEDEESESNSD